MTDIQSVFHMRKAAYAKNMIAVTCPSPDGFKTRAANLANLLSKGRYTQRERAFLLSRKKAAKFLELVEAGYDASAITGRLIPPISEEGDGI